MESMGIHLYTGNAPRGGHLFRGVSGHETKQPETPLPRPRPGSPLCTRETPPVAATCFVGSVATKRNSPKPPFPGRAPEAPSTRVAFPVDRWTPMGSMGPHYHDYIKNAVRFLKNA